MIDFCIQSHSRKFTFTKHVDDIKILLNREQTLKFKDFDYKTQKVLNTKRLQRIKDTYDFFSASYVTKNIKRNNFLESFFYYQRYVLEPLLEVLRMKYCPHKMKYGYSFKDLAKDIPIKYISRVESFYKLKSVKDIENAMKEVRILLFKIVDDMDKN